MSAILCCLNSLTNQGPRHMQIGISIFALMCILISGLLTHKILKPGEQCACVRVCALFVYKSKLSNISAFHNIECTKHLCNLSLRN